MLDLKWILANLDDVRAEVIDDQGRHAWTNPILLKQQDE